MWTVLVGVTVAIRGVMSGAMLVGRTAAVGVLKPAVVMVTARVVMVTARVVMVTARVVIYECQFVMVACCHGGVL